jgi:hypothetical protein
LLQADGVRDEQARKPLSAFDAQHVIDQVEQMHTGFANVHHVLMPPLPEALMDAERRFGWHSTSRMCVASRTAAN